MHGGELGPRSSYEVPHGAQRVKPRPKPENGDLANKNEDSMGFIADL